eukprot:TRINITY_DN37304_c0_g1_i1.p1 TRINITY_DN37304_c0_g1~~TRINITY_DN37304_c0_g1_i1.p1  ORF type:complete len:724 (+),score=158.89 TRINITY_DN37304_c0_g1_i1:220-2172(+)
MDDGGAMMPRMATSPAPMAVVAHDQHAALLNAHHQLVSLCTKQHEAHSELMKAHTQLLTDHQKTLETLAKHVTSGGGGGANKRAATKPHPSLGVIRLDYNYPPAAGDIDCPGSYGYDVFFRVVPGLTFEMAQAGRFTEAVERKFAEGIKYLEQKGVNAITGDCGFMMAFQVLARKIASKPVFMSSMCQIPVIAAAFEPHDQILILTANGLTLKPQKEVLLSSCGFDVNEDRFVIKGCQDVPGFDAVAKGEAVPLDVVQPGVVKLTKQILRQNPRIRGILLECTELPPYADALRAKTGLPVWDAITGADFYINAFKDNPRFGINDWLNEWDGEQDEYKWGQNLNEDDVKVIVNKQSMGVSNKTKKKPPNKQAMKKTAKKVAKQQHPTLGVIRLDYNYPPAAGDIDCPGSYDYDVLYRVVPGLTFEMAQAGKMTYNVETEFRKAIKWLEQKGCAGITGDCGFMMAFQPIAREVANIPVFMSSMVQCPMVSVAFDKYDKILILTANSLTLKPQKNVLLSHCGFDVDDERFVIRGCQDVPGFDAVAKGGKVDVERVTPGVVKLTKDILQRNPSIRAILLECTELPPYSDALRHATGLPVFDAITNADFFISARQDNPRFGLNQWQNDWDEQQDEYSFGENLTEAQKAHTLYLNK